MKNRYILSILFAFVLTMAISQPEPFSTPPNMVATDIDGNEVDLEQILAEGKVVIVDLFAAWCGPCWDYHMQHVLEDAYQQWGPAGTNELVVIGIEAEATNTPAQLTGTTTSQSRAGLSLGDWTEGISYPIIDNSTFNNSFGLGYYPTIIAIFPNRLMFEMRPQPLTVIREILDESPGLATDDRDVNPVFYTGTDKTCSNAEIKFRLHNNGTKNLTQATIQVLDGEEVAIETQWTGDLASYEQEEVTVGIIDYVEESKDYVINIVQENGEENIDNNLLTAGITANKTENVDVILKVVTDLYPGETNWFIFPEGSDVHIATGGYADGPGAGGAGGDDANKEHFHNITLNGGLGCYTIEIRDGYLDGMTYVDFDLGHPYPGYELLDAADSSVIRSLDPSDPLFEDSTSDFFELKTGGATSVSKIEGLENIKLFPNPATDLVTVEFDLENRDALQISVINTMGQVVYQNAEIDYTYGQVQEQINVSNFNAGLYFLEVANSNGEKNTLKFNVIK